MLIFFMVSIVHDGCIGIRQQYLVGREFISCLLSIFVLGYADIRLRHKQSLLGSSQFIPVPITDGRVQRIFNVVDDQLLIATERLIVRIIIGIAVGLYVKQLHVTVRGSGDGQRNIHLLAVSVCCASICRDVLVIDIYRTLNVPVVGGNFVCTHVFVADVVAVINNGLRAVYEVT